MPVATVTTAARPSSALPAHDPVLRFPGESESEFWSVSIDQLLGEVRSSPAGLNGDEARRRLATHGPNVAVRHVSKGLLRGLADQFRSPITLLLFIAAAISIGVGERVDGTVILLILLVSGLLGFWQEHHAATAVNELLSLVRTTTSVKRDGQLTSVPIEEIVPGDVVSLSAGATIPGDARLLDSNDLFVDQAALTGESYPAEKAPGTVASDAALADRTNAIHLGTHVVSGAATALIVRTGPDTEFGEIAQRLELRPPQTEFELGVRHFGYLLLEITFILAIITFAANMALHRPVLDSLLFTLALAVGLTPQLLPAIVSVTLAQGARHMAAERVIVRRLVSIEDLGGMQILCTDKTGTITEGVVSIRAVEDWNGAASERAHLFACINAQLESGFSNPIDDALRAHPVAGVERYAKVDEVPYDFIRKRLSVVVREDEQRRLLITKGAVTSVVEICDSGEDSSGRVFPIADVRAAIDTRVEAFSHDACRCLAVAYKRLDTDAPVGREAEQGLTFLGLLALSDPLKPNVRETLSDLSQLGIRLTLITGDNRHVASEIASEAGLDASAIRTGSDLRHLTEDALVRDAPRISVFAEVEPNQKERIIRALKKSGHSVGYLGDGINDAAALHAADVGISVDSATDVTKQAADIVLLDKDLAVLGRGVREGRRAFANMLKYVFITTSANFGNMFSMAGATFFASFLPLLPKQILLINVLSDLPAMAIATDRLDPELVVKPRRWDNRSIRRFMITFGIVSSVFDYLTFGALLFLHVSASTFRTAWFLESVLSEILILLVIRTRRAFFRSPIGSALLWSSVAAACVTVALPYTPLGPLLGFVPLPFVLVAGVCGVVGLYVLASEASKRLLFSEAHL